VLPRIPTQRFKDHFNYTVDILQYLVVPKAHHAVATPFKFGRPTRIFCDSRRLVVLPSVKFYYQLVIFAAEVNDEIANWKLAAEFDRFKAFGSQLRPELALSVGFFVSQLACTMK